MAQRAESTHDNVLLLLLCRTVRKFPVVYDRNHKEYNNKELYEEAWAAIAAECQDSVNTCKSRWKSIRDNYVRSIRGTPKKRSSSRIKDNYLSDVLDFLAPHVQTNNEHDEVDRFENVDTVNKEKDAKKSKANNSSKLTDPLAISTDQSTKSTNENHSHDIYKVSKKSTKEGGTLVLKKTSDIKKVLNIDNEEENIDGNNDDDMPRSSYRRSCKRSLDKNEINPKKNKIISKPLTASKRPQRRASMVNTKNNLYQASESESEDDERPLKFRIFSSETQVKPNLEKQTTDDTEKAPTPAKKIIVVNNNNTIKPIMCEKSTQCVQSDTRATPEDIFFEIFKPYLKIMNSRQRLVLSEHIFKAIVTTLDDCRDFSGASTPVANEINKRLFKENLGTKEMHLVNEMVNLIQAVKHTPDPVIVSSQSKKADEKTAENKSESTPKLIVRKPIELRSNGSVFSISTPTAPGAKPGAAVPCRVLEKFDGDNKRRIYRIIPKTNAGNHAALTANSASTLNSSTNASIETSSNTLNTSITTTANITAPTFSTPSVISPHPSVSVIGTTSLNTSTTVSATTTSPSHLMQSGASYVFESTSGNARNVSWAPPRSLVTTSTVSSNISNRNTVTRAQAGTISTVRLPNRRFSICDPSVLNRVTNAGINGPLPQIITALPKNSTAQRIIGAHPIQISNGLRVRPVTLFDNQNAVFISAAPTPTTHSSMQNNTPTTISTVNTVPSLTPIIQKSTVPIVVAPVKITPNVALNTSSTASNIRPINNPGGQLRQNVPTIVKKSVQKPIQKSILRKGASKPQAPPDNSDSQEETAGIISTDELGPWIKNEPLDELNF